MGTLKNRKVWTKEEDDLILQMRNKEHKSWDVIAAAIGVWRQTAKDRGYVIGALASISRSRPTELKVDRNLGRFGDGGFWDSLPAGHPVSWGAITEGTLLEGTPYVR